MEKPKFSEIMEDIRWRLTPEGRSATAEAREWAREAGATTRAVSDILARHWNQAKGDDRKLLRTWIDSYGGLMGEVDDTEKLDKFIELVSRFGKDPEVLNATEAVVQAVREASSVPGVAKLIEWNETRNQNRPRAV